MGRRGKGLNNRIRPLRAQAALSQDELALLAGITRQSVNAIENGQYVPNTVVAIQLARALGVPVEDLFSLPPTDERLAMRPPDVSRSQRVLAAAVDGRFVAHGLAGPHGINDGFAVADGVYDHATGETSLFTPREVLERTAILVGCDPSLGLLASRVTAMSAHHRLMWVPGSSTAALHAIRTKRAHIAGVHLRDHRTGAFNDAALLNSAADQADVVAYAGWEQGFVVGLGNPRGIRGVSDLVADNTRFVNREPGSGSRLVLDQALAAEGVPRSGIRGYEHSCDSHMDVARHVATGAADVGLAIEAVARAMDLDFVPLVPAAFDLIVPHRHRQHPAVALMLDLLQEGGFRRELSTLPGYDVTTTGKITALN